MYPLTQLFSRYQQWQPALLMLAFFCAEVAFSAISTPLTNTLNAIGKINETLKLMIMWTVLNWTVTPVMINFFGYQGVAFASMLIGCTAFITIAIVKKYVQISFVDQIWRQLVACFVMGGVLWFTVHLWSRSYLWLGAGVLFGGAVYAATILLVGYKKLFSELQSLKT
jgi:O-antigen/teichoic acid export membrane protein